jgi:hypothetical protein
VIKGAGAGAAGISKISNRRVNFCQCGARLLIEQETKELAGENWLSTSSAFSLSRLIRKRQLRLKEGGTVVQVALNI